LNGTLVASAAAQSGYTGGQHYTLLTAAGGISGTFAFLTSLGTPANVRYRLAYDANDVYLYLDPVAITPSLAAGATVNQRAVAAGVDRAITGGATLSSGFITLSGLSGATLGGALDQISGEGSSAVVQTSLDASKSFLATLLDPAVDRGSAQWTVWATGLGGAGHTDGAAVTGSRGVNDHVQAMVAGVDYVPMPGLVLGAAAGIGGTNFSLSGTASRGSANLYQVGGFAQQSFDAAYGAAAISYSRQDVTTNRMVTVAGTDQLQAKLGSDTVSGRLERGYRFLAEAFDFTPYAAVQLAVVSLPAYGETAVAGTGTFALQYAGHAITDVRTETGLRLGHAFAMEDGGSLALHGGLGWVNDNSPIRTVGASFQGLPAAQFTVDGARPAPNAVAASASAELRLLSGLSFDLSANGEFSGNSQSVFGRGGLRYSW
jgi:uncharacterized protein with beta-barrel porin domain